MTNPVVIYELPNGVVAIYKPNPDYLAVYGIDTLAQKDVPAGVPFWIIDESDLPSDWSARDRWRLDGSQGEPHGYGHISSTFEGVLGLEG